MASRFAPGYGRRCRRARPNSRIVRDNRNARSARQWSVPASRAIAEATHRHTGAAAKRIYKIFPAELRGGRGAQGRRSRISAISLERFLGNQRGLKARMKIKEIILREVPMKLVAPFETSMDRVESRRVLLVEANVDGGTAWGE